jgi:hypothetical protein
MIDPNWTIEVNKSNSETNHPQMSPYFGGSIYASRQMFIAVKNTWDQRWSTRPLHLQPSSLHWIPWVQFVGKSVSFCSKALDLRTSKATDQIWFSSQSQEFSKQLVPKSSRRASRICSSLRSSQFCTRWTSPYSRPESIGAHGRRK